METKMRDCPIASHALLSSESTSDGLVFGSNQESEAVIGFQQSTDRLHSTTGIRSISPEVVASAESEMMNERFPPQEAVPKASLMLYIGKSGAYDAQYVREVEQNIGKVKMELRDVEKRIRRIEQKLSSESPKYDARNLIENRALHDDLIRERRQFIEEKTSWRNMKNILIDNGVSELSKRRYPESLKLFERQQNSTEFFMETLEDLSHACRWEGKYFEFPMEISEAVFGVNDTIVLHRRPAIDKLYELLNERRMGGLIQEPPGVGKSTSVFAYALGLATSGKDRIAWVKSDSKTLLIIEGYIIKRFCLRCGVSWDPVVNMVRKGNFQYIFVDQCRGNGEVGTILTDLNKLGECLQISPLRYNFRSRLQ